MLKRFVVSICALMLILAACAAPIAPAAPNTPTVVPASAPTATAVPPVVAPTAATTAPIPASDPDTFSLPASCYREGLPIYVNRAAEFCFAYPQHFSLGEMTPGQPAIFGPALDTNTDPLRATFTFQVERAAGKSLADHLAAYALKTGTSPETELAEVALDGEASKVIEPVKGRPNAKNVLVLHGNNLYTLSFAPTFKDTPAAQQTDVWKKGQQDMQALYEIVTSSFAFLDQPRAAGANNVLGITPSCLLEGNSLYLDSNQGYCLAVPPHYTVDEMNPGQRAIFGPALDASPDPLRVSLLVDVKPVLAGSEIWKVADEFVKANPNPAITRGASEIGRQAAIMLGNVPGRSNSFNVLTVNNGKLYNLYFQPYGNPRAKPDLDALSAMVMGSFGFLPSAASANSEKPANSGLPVNFEYGTDLVQDVKLRAVPALTEPFIPFDTYQYDFDGYVVKSSMPPHLWAFNTNLPPQSDSTLRGIDALAHHVAARTTPGKTLPVYLTGLSANQLNLPMFVPVNARPILSTQWSLVQGSGVIGLRFVTVYMQGPNPLEPNTLVYAFSGLNPERNVAFAAVFPVRPAAALKLPAANIKALLDDPAKLDAYNQQIAEQIAQLGPSDFVPDLHRIDEIMASLTAWSPLPPMIAKSDTQIVMENCVRDGMKNEVNTIDGYCFAYPARFELTTSPTGQPQLAGPVLDQNLDALRASMALEVEVAVKDVRLSEIVDRYVDQFAGMNIPAITRTPIVLSGEPAEVLEVVPGREGSRDVFMLHEGTLYHFMFMPSVRDFPQAKNDVEELYNAVTQSFSFTSKKPRPIEVSASPRDPSVTGTARWGTMPIPDAIVELRTGDWRVNPNATLRRTTTDPEGRYTMPNPPVGDYVMCGLFPDGMQERSTCTPVHVEAGQDVTGIDVMLLRTVYTASPAVDEQVSAKPTLSWQSFPNAAKYEVFVIDAGTTELMQHEFVTDTQFTVSAALKPGRTYQWVVNAVGGDGGLLADVDSRFSVQQ